MRLAARLFAALALLLDGGGCQQQRSCNCRTPDAVTILLPAEVARGAIVHVSGVPCGTLDITEASCAVDHVDGGGCPRYSVFASQAGACHIDIELAGGSHFVRDVVIASGTGDCCGQPTAALLGQPSEIDVPVPQVDGGAGG